MARRDEYESRVEKFLIPIMEENNFELVDVEYVKEAGTWYLRVISTKRAALQWMTVRWYRDAWRLAR